MTVQDFLNKVGKTLGQAGISSARLDSFILLEDALGLDRTTILAHPELDISEPKLKILNKQITQRINHTPLAYIRGRAPFFGREFAIDKHVLVPRPETETMVEMLLKLSLPASPIIADIGTGTGCLGITAALELPRAQVSLYDIDEAALRLAKRNAIDLGAKVLCQKNDLLEKVSGTDVILANLPYVPERYTINRAAEHEPKHAIFGGKDGLNLYRRLWQQIDALAHKPKLVLTESLPPQHKDLAALAKQARYNLTKTQDFIQVFELT